MTDHSAPHTSPTRRDFLRNAALASGLWHCGCCRCQHCGGRRWGAPWTMGNQQLAKSAQQNLTMNIVTSVCV